MGLTNSFSPEGVSNSTVVIASMIAAFSVYGVSKLLFRNNKPQEITRSQPKIYQPEIFSASTSTASSRSEKQEKVRPVP